jgi:hypothetical protein
MNLLFIVIILLLIVGLALFFKLIKNVFKAAIYFFVLLAILLFLGGIFVYTDAADFKSKIANESNTFLLIENDQVLSGVKVINIKTSDILLLNDATIKQYQDEYKKKNLELIRGSSYKIFIFNISSLRNLNETLVYGPYRIKSNDAVDLLKSPTPIDGAVLLFNNNTALNTVVKQQLLVEFKSDQEFKGALFSLFVAKLFPAKTLYIVERMKTKEIQVYPETAMFKALQMVPTSWVSNSLRGGSNQSEVLEKKG